jgi:hypothetical protein
VHGNFLQQTTVRLVLQLEIMHIYMNCERVIHTVLSFRIRPIEYHIAFSSLKKPDRDSLSNKIDSQGEF